jgi:hypothetical protein
MTDTDSCPRQFAEIEPILKERPNISHIHVITDAFVPVVKFNCNGVEMDCKDAPVPTGSLGDWTDFACPLLLANCDGFLLAFCRWVVLV